MAWLDRTAQVDGWAGPDLWTGLGGLDCTGLAGLGLGLSPNGCSPYNIISLSIYRERSILIV